MMTYIALAAALVLVGIDQLTKWLAVNFIKPEGTINLISFGDKEWINLTYQQNTGAAFSILRDKQSFLIILTSIVILGVIILMLTKRIKKPVYIWSFSLILAGGTGNLIDRIVNGYVVDFIDVRIIKFAVFNFADICAVVGTIMLLLFCLIDEIKSSKKKKKSSASEETDNVLNNENTSDNQKKHTIEAEIKRRENVDGSAINDNE